MHNEVAVFKKGKKKEKKIEMAMERRRKKGHNNKVRVSTWK